jgi:hypothetical protein
MPLYLDIHTLDTVAFDDVAEAHGLVADEIYQVREGA